MRQGLRFWDDRTPPARRQSWPTWKPSKGGAGDRADIVVIGGGLTGCASAYAFAAAGYSVILLEAARIASGATAGSTGLLLSGFDGSFASHDALHGRRASRAMWQQARRGVLEFAALIRRLGIRCDLESTSVITIANDVKALAKEYGARREAGLQVSRLTASAAVRETAVEDAARAAMRTPGAFTFDPVRATLGLASHAGKAGARIFEQSPVLRVKHLPRGRGVQVRTAAGMIAAQAAVIATGSAGPLVSQLRRHFITRDTYIIVTEPMPGAMRRGVGQRKSALMDSGTPPHTVRWLKDDRVMISGADQPAPPARLTDRTLTQRTGQLMYELSLLYPALSGIQPAYSWAVQLATTADGAPFVGPHRNLPGHLLSLGFGRHGDGLAWLAARALVRYHRGAPTKDDAVFGFTRHDA
ncbi:MAG: FAD-binding oxidoreductase [Vicinamibacterales bacterium]